MRAERFFPFFQILMIGLLGTTSATAAAAAELRCVAWPGEISPLPTVDHEDPLRAEWASRRAEELAALARTVERSNQGEAYRVWQHVACLDPGNESAHKAMAALSLVRVHQPQAVQVTAEPVPARFARIEDAFANLSQPIQVGPRRAVEVAQAAPASRDRATEDLDRKLGQAGALVREARFREALANAAQSGATFLKFGGDAKRSTPKSVESPISKHREASALESATSLSSSPSEAKAQSDATALLTETSQAQESNATSALGAASEEAPLSESLALEPVLVSVNATPWAIIEVDGIEFGETPLAEIPLLPGLHKFVAKMPGGRVVERTIQIDQKTQQIVFD